MATRYSIQMDFDEAKRQAGAVDEIADALDGEANRSLSDILNTLGNDWRGENAHRYLKKGFTLIEDMNHTADALHTAADTVRSTAQRIYDAEMENLRIAEERQAAEEERHRRVMEARGGMVFKP